MGNIIEIAFRIRVIQINGWWENALGDGESEKNSIHTN